MKDNFSNRSDKYKKFRPGYPVKMYDYLLSLTENKQVAWDCGTGNAQVAQVLAKHFTSVYATDISESQIQHAVKLNNIYYRIERAEKTSFPSEIFDFITVAQAIHWFNFDLFYKEVERTMKPNGKLAVIGYGLFTTDEKTDLVINRFYKEIVGSYWDKERKYIDENYETIPFPFKEIKSPAFENICEWTFEQMIGYLETWSAVQHCIKANYCDPVSEVYNDLKQPGGMSIQKQYSFQFF